MPTGSELPRLLTGHRTAAFGKWHLEDQTAPDPLAPWSHGYDYFEGTLWGVPSTCGPVLPQPCNPSQLTEGASYYQWVKTTIDQGVLSTTGSTRYLPLVTVKPRHRLAGRQLLPAVVRLPGAPGPLRAAALPAR